MAASGKCSVTPVIGRPGSEAPCRGQSAGPIVRRRSWERVDSPGAGCGGLTWMGEGWSKPRCPAACAAWLRLHVRTH